MELLPLSGNNSFINCTEFLDIQLLHESFILITSFLHNIETIMYDKPLPQKYFFFK